MITTAEVSFGDDFLSQVITTYYNREVSHPSHLGDLVIIKLTSLAASLICIQ